MEYESKVTRAGYNPDDLGFRLETKTFESRSFQDMTPEGIKQVTRRISMERVLGHAKIIGGTLTLVTSGLAEGIILSFGGHAVVRGTEINPPLLALQVLVPALLFAGGWISAQSGAKEAHLADSRLKALRQAASETETLINYPKSNTIDFVSNVGAEQASAET